jgi:hypothetical protein
MKRVVVACIAVLGLTAALVAPGPALGHVDASRAQAHRIAPPGISGVNQYVENVPTAKGGRPTSTIHSGGGSAGVGGGGGSAGSGTIPPGTEHALQTHGAAGKAAAALASATAPRGPSHDNGSRGRTDASANVQGPGGGSPPAAVFDSLTGAGGSGGLGILLPVILVGCLLAAGALAYSRWRRHNG